MMKTRKMPLCAISMIGLETCLALLISLVGLGGVALGQPGGQVPTLIPLVAQSAGAPTAFPDTTSFSFEDPNTTTFTYYGTMTPPANTWASWTMNGSAGIAANGSGFTSLNPNTPDGTRVAFLQGTGSLETTITLQPGTWRLNFLGAQRMRPAGPNQQVVRVTIGGIEVAEVELGSMNYDAYSTRPISVDVATSMTVVFSGVNPQGGDNTALLDKIELQPIAEWDASSTWGGTVPTPAHPTIIPANVAVAVRGMGNKARNVTVAGELLASNRESNLRAQWVMVSGANSLFEVGRPETPFEEDFTLTLTASRTSPAAPMGGTKFLIAMNGGTLNLHGQPKVSWTKLNLSANPNDTSITVLDQVNWEPGDEIIIAGTTHQKSTGGPGGLPNYVDFAELKRVESIDPNGVLIHLDTSPTGLGAIANVHHGGTPTDYNSQGKTWTLDQRAEVGLITHNVKIQGNANSEVEEFGGHIMVMRPTGTNHGSAYISNVELYRMGQKQGLGRYPMHWHMMLGEAQGQYFNQCSVHRSYNRAITIHGTDFVTVSNNVVYDTVGHAVFLEDGSEQYNTITDNLVLSTIKPVRGEEMLLHDNQLEQPQNRMPASFWITNPANTVTGNVVAGTEGTGFWLIFPDLPTGLSKSDPEAAAYFSTPTQRMPRFTALGAFEDNVCHSSGSGFDVNDALDEGDPMNPLDENIFTNVAWTPPSTETLSRFTVWGCDMGIYAGTSSQDIVFDNCVVADNNENIRLAAYHTVQNSVVIASTGNSGNIVGGERGYVVYDGPARVKDSYFVDFDQNNNQWVISGAGAATLHPNHLFSGITHRYTSSNTLPTVDYANFAAAVDASGNPINHDCINPLHLANARMWGMAVRDVDGSLWGTPDSTIIGNHPLQFIPQADITPLNAPSAHAKLSPFRFGHLRIMYPGVNPSSYPDLTLQRGANGIYPGTVPYLDCLRQGNHKQWPVIVQDGFFYILNWVASPLPINNIILTMDDVELMDSSYILLGGVGAQQSTLTVTNATEVGDINALRAATTTSYVVLGSNLAVKFIGVNKRLDLNLSW